jgi:hypothetical protein
MTDPAKGALRRLISGALRSCINEHGPITKNEVGSAAMRIESQLRGYIGTMLNHAAFRLLGEQDEGDER